jgi:hypothetical protein
LPAALSQFLASSTPFSASVEMDSVSFFRQEPSLRIALTIPSMLLGCLVICGCSTPNSNQVRSPFIPRQKTEAATRLQLVRGSFVPSIRMAMEAPSGVLEVKLRVDSQGLVKTVSMVGGSLQMWSIYRQSIQGLRFSPMRQDDKGPWDLFMVFSSTSSGFGGHLESVHTGRSESSSSMSMQIVDVVDVMDTRPSNP